MKLSRRLCRVLPAIIATVMMLMSNIIVMAEEISGVSDTYELEYKEDIFRDDIATDYETTDDTVDINTNEIESLEGTEETVDSQESFAATDTIESEKETEEVTSNNADINITEDSSTTEEETIVPVESIQLSETEKTLEEGETAQLTATILPENATDKTVVWESSDETVVTVENGLVTAIKNGTATITVRTTDGTVTATCSVTITEHEQTGEISWDIAGGVLTITGTGPMEDYASASDAPWYSRRNEVTKVVIGDGITSIGDWVFAESRDLKTITIPYGVMSIGNCSFENCYNLVEITIPDSINSIGRGAFFGCKSLECFEIPDSVDSIGNAVFENCTSLRKLVLSNNIDYIGDSVFYNCKHLEGIIIPYGVNTIGTAAFCNCISLTEIVIPNSVSSIGDRAFSNCIGLTSVVIPESVERIGISSFYNCENLSSLVLQNGIKEIGDSAFRDCEKLKSIIIPESITMIGNGLFDYCTELKSVTIPVLDTISFADMITGSPVTEVVITGNGPIPNNAFRECDTLVSVIIKEGITSLGDYSFANCKCLTSITIPKSVSSLGAGVFYNCSGLQLIELSENLKNIGDNAFIFSGIVSITIPDSVNNIGEALFANCKNLTRITVPTRLLSKDTVSTAVSEVVLTGEGEIPSYAFNNLTMLTNVYIPEGVTNIGEYAFHYCKMLTNISIPESVKSIGNKAFAECSSLKTIKLPDGLQYIGAGSFQYCAVLQTIDIPIGVTSIEKEVFYGCDSLKEITIPQNVSNISDFSFFGCRELTVINIPASVKSIGIYAFVNCSAEIHVYGLDLENIAANTCSFNEVSIVWDSVKGADFYAVYRSESKDGTYKLLTNSLTTNSFVSRSLACGTTYYYKVKAGKTINRTKVWGDESSIVSVTPKLNAPTGVTATPSSSSTVDMHWEKVEGAQYYQVYRMPSPDGKLALLGVYDENTFNSVSRKLGANTTYYYKVRCYRWVNGERVFSPFSTVVSARTFANANATVVNFNTIELTWDSEDGAECYAVYRSESENGTYKLLTNTLTENTFTSKLLATGTTYYYRIKAKKTVDGEKVWVDHAVATATPVLPAPTGVTATPSSSSTVDMHWEKVEGAQYYQVYRMPSPNGKLALLGVYDENTFNSVSRKLAADTTYYYKVRCYRWVNGERVFSPFSEVVSAKTWYGKTPIGPETYGYWTAGGKSFHLYGDCPTLSRSSNVKEGIYSQSSKTDICNDCSQRMYGRSFD